MGLPLQLVFHALVISYLRDIRSGNPIGGSTNLSLSMLMGAATLSIITLSTMIFRISTLSIKNLYKTLRIMTFSI